MNDKKAKYQRKEVTFGGKKHVLWSIDGNTWSTRKDELIAIQDRHENEKVTFGEIKGIAPKKFPPRRALQGADTERIEKSADEKTEANYDMDTDVEFVSESDDGKETRDGSSHKKTAKQAGKQSGKPVQSHAIVPKTEKQKKESPKKGECKKAVAQEKGKKNLPAKAVANNKAAQKRKPAAASPKKRTSAGSQKPGKAAKSKVVAKKSGKRAA